MPTTASTSRRSVSPRHAHASGSRSPPSVGRSVAAEWVREERWGPMLARVPTPPGFEEIQGKELSRLFGRLVGIRLAAIPIAVVLSLAIAVFDPARWRVALLGGLLATVGLYFVSGA